MEELNVLSLFDWISCWMAALEKENIPVNNYYASEIEKYAIKISEKNYPNIIRLWDVKKINYSDKVLFSENKQAEYIYEVDLLIWWSPCQWFSLWWKQLNFDDPRSKLFFEFVRILKEVKPKYFLLENVFMKKEYQDIITWYLWVEPIKINSNLVSAQNRKRLYWTNIPVEKNITDKEILLKNIIQNPDEICEKYYLSKKAIDYMNRKTSALSDRWKRTCNQPNKKSETLTASMVKWVPYWVIFQRGRWVGKWWFKALNWKTPCLSSNSWQQNNFLYLEKPRRLTPIECERLQTLPDNYTKWVSNSQRYKMLWNAWTVDVIAHIFSWLKKEYDKNNK